MGTYNCEGPLKLRHKLAKLTALQIKNFRCMHTNLDSKYS